VAIEYLIGVDGGGSGTRVRVVAAQGGRVLGQGHAGPSGLSQGVAQAWTHIDAAIAMAFDAAPPAPARCALGLGLAGVHDAALRNAFLQAAPAFAALVVETDGHTALIGAHGGAPGVVLAAGTGSVGEVLRANGERASAGGWGFPAGDEGSGAWLGLRAMALAQQALDGRARAAALARAVWRHTAADEASLRRWLADAGQQRYAELAPLVFEHENADPAAAALLERAVGALEELALALDGSRTLPVAVVGSIGQRLAPRLNPALRARSVAPAGDAIDGALQLVRRACVSSA